MHSCSLSFSGILLKKAEKFLKEDSLSPRRDAEILLASCLKISTKQLLSISQEKIEKISLEWWELLARRKEGMPVQYLCGEIEFYGRHFFCDERALIPRPETEELIDLVKALSFSSSIRILDLGCGSGVIGLTLQKEMEKAEIVLADISLEAISLAKQNAALLDIAEKMIFTRSNLFSEISGTFDLICANLPYVGENERNSLQKELSYEPEMALFGGEKGLDVILKCIKQARGFLREGGKFILEIGEGQSKIVQKSLEENGFSSVECLKDLAGIERFAIAS